jgi:hypothetical protein
MAAINCSHRQMLWWSQKCMSMSCFLSGARIPNKIHTRVHHISFCRWLGCTCVRSGDRPVYSCDGLAASPFTKSIINPLTTPGLLFPELLLPASSLAHFHACTSSGPLPETTLLVTLFARRSHESTTRILPLLHSSSLSTRSPLDSATSRRDKDLSLMHDRVHVHVRDGRSFRQGLRNHQGPSLQLSTPHQHGLEDYLNLRPLSLERYTFAVSQPTYQAISLGPFAPSKPTAS